MGCLFVLILVDNLINYNCMKDKIFCFKFRNRRGVIYLETSEEYDPEMLFTGKIKNNEVFKARISKGTTYCPYCYLPDPYNLGISEKFRSDLIENGVTGWGNYTIEIANCNFKYYGLQILGTKVMLKRPATTGSVRGMELDMSGWDGSDIFAASGMFQIFFTPKVRNILLTSKMLCPEEIVDISELEWYSAAL